MYEFAGKDDNILVVVWDLKAKKKGAKKEPEVKHPPLAEEYASTLSEAMLMAEYYRRLYPHSVIDFIPTD